MEKFWGKVEKKRKRKKFYTAKKGFTEIVHKKDTKFYREFSTKRWKTLNDYKRRKNVKKEKLIFLN